MKTPPTIEDMQKALQDSWEADQGSRAAGITVIEDEHREAEGSAPVSASKPEGEDNAEEAIRQVIAERKPENDGEIIFSPEQQKIISLMNVKMKVYTDRIRDLYNQRGEDEHLSETVLSGILEEQVSRMFASMRERGIFEAKEKEGIINKLLNRNL